MSLSRRRLLIAAALLPLAGATTSCVVRPLYGTAFNDEAEGSADLASTAIQPIPGRSGQVLHNRLRDLLNPRGQPVRARYDLAVALQEREQRSGLRRTETATRNTLTLDADYQLVDRESGEVLTQGEARSLVGFNLVDSGYANYVSSEDAQERALAELAQEIRRRLALHFAEAAEG